MGISSDEASRFQDVTSLDCCGLLDAMNFDCRDTQAAA